MKTRCPGRKMDRGRDECTTMVMGCSLPEADVLIGLMRLANPSKLDAASGVWLETRRAGFWLSSCGDGDCCCGWLRGLHRVG